MSCWDTWASGEFERPDSEQVRAIIEEANWTQEFAAELVGVDDRTMRRYCNPDDTDMPYAQWQLLLYHANYDIGDRAMPTEPRDDDD